MTTRLAVGLAGLVAILPVAQQVRGDLVSIQKTNSTGGEIAAGNQVTYTIKAQTGNLPSTDVHIVDPLPVFRSITKRGAVEYLHSSCDADPPTEFVPPCLNGEAFLRDDQVLIWQFPGVTPPNTMLIATATVLVNKNVDDEFIIENCAKVDDAEPNSGPLSDCDEFEVVSSNLGLFKSARDSLGEELVDGTDFVSGGDRITYILEVDNFPKDEGLPANGVVIQDTLPPNVSFVPGSAQPSGFPDNCTVCGVCTSPGGGPCPAKGGIVTWQYDILHPNEARQLRFDVVVDENVGPQDPIFNLAVVFDDVGHFRTASHTLNSETPCLGIDKRVVSCRHPQPCGRLGLSCGRATQPGPLDIVTYEVTVRNGCGRAEGVEVIDPIPQFMEFVECSTAMGGCFLDEDDNVVWGVGALSAGESATLTLRLQADAGVLNGTEIENAATATAANSNDSVSDSATVTVRPPRLNVTKVGSPIPVEPGGFLLYAISLSNSGVNCSPGVDLLDVLPLNAVLQLGTVDFSTCKSLPFFPPSASLAVASNGSKFSIQEFDLDPGESCTVSFRMEVPQRTAVDTEVVNTVMVTDDQLNSAQFTSIIPVQTRIVGLSKIVSGCTFPPGGATCSLANPPPGAELTYTIAVSTGAFTSANTRVIDILPSLDLVSFSGTDCPNFDQNGTRLTCFLNDIPPNSSATFRITVLIKQDVPSGTLLVNTASATNEALDEIDVTTDVTEDVVVQAIQPTPPTPVPTPVPTPQLQVRVNVPDTIKLSRRLKYTVTVTNVGERAALNVQLTDTLPGGTRLVKLEPFESCVKDRQRGAFTCSLGDLAPGASASVEVQASVRRRYGAKAGDQIVNTFTATSGNSPPGIATAVVRVLSRR